ncbi:ABC1 kinase family protein [Lignipirellula cremea]|uniref:Protein kinase domain-containing protein n=1 Tax=Lignipirellula cremea TaxID=2528010 RepID=A0A518E2D1_9BACT|nr:AarF/ABC1/UbiB kinase family protein [Lignipirellula cremea]QDU98249.1 putative protein kinase UbiB [Lignipirellula cremea]
MKISAIPQIYQNLRRWGEILSVLSKYGLADWLSRVNIDFVKDRLRDPDGEILARHSPESRIRLALQELGPTFIKLGQILSTRADLVGTSLANELGKLQSGVRADGFDEIRKIVESELGQPIEELFREFSPEPIASASIGQVHLARLKQGGQVAVKVQHVGIERIIREDLDLLAGAAQLAEKIPEFALYHPTTLVAEMARSLRRELDFGREERNLLQFSAMFAEDPTVKIPQPFTDYCTSRVLTMERIVGLKLTEPVSLAARGLNLEEIARRGAELYLKMIFKHGFFHADPHPGNMLVLPSNVIGLLDFGMVGRINEKLREDIEEMLLAIVSRDPPLLTAIIKRVGSMPANLDSGLLMTDVTEYVDQYSTQSLEKFDFSGAMNDMMEIVRRHQIALPSEVVMLLKAMVTLEGTARLLNPRFSLMELMQPLQRTLLLRRMSPLRQIRKMRRMYMQLENLAEMLPERVMDILDQVQAGKFDVHLDHRRLGPTANRMVLGLMTSALFVGSAEMLSNQVPPLLFPQATYLGGMHRISLLGLSGVMLSLLIGLRLLWAIRKSGNLDQK